MKKNLLFVFLFLLTACTHSTFYINQAMKANNLGFLNKLPNLEIIYESESELKNYSYGDTFVRINKPTAVKFYREVEQNLINTDTQKQGFIILTPIILSTEEKYDYWKGLGYIGFCELEIRILDKNGKIIKKYSSESYTKFYTAVFGSSDHGCSSNDNCRDKAYWTAYETSLNDLIKQIHNDTDYLRQQLVK